MNTRTTVVLLALVIVAGLLYLFAEPFQPPGEDAGQGRLLRGFDRGGIEEIEVIRGKDRFVFHRRSESDTLWDLTEPLHAEADDEGVRQILSALEYNDGIGLAVKGEPDPAHYGLDTPRGIVRARGGDQEWEVAVGAGDPVGSHVYARIGSAGAIVRTGENLWTAIAKDLGDFRERNLLRTRSWEVTRVEIQGGDRVLELRKEEGDWRIAKPLALRADSAKIDPLLTELAAVRALTFAADDPPSLDPYGLDTPRWRVTLGKKSGDLEVLLVGAPGPEEGQVYALREGSKTVALVGDAFLDSLDQDAAAFRSTQVVRAIAETAKEITVRRGGKVALRAHREDLRWSLDEPESRPAEGDAIREWLRSLEGLEITKFVEDSPQDLTRFGLGEGTTHVEVVRGEEEADRVGLAIGDSDPDGEGTYLKRDDENAVSLVPASSLAFLERPAWELRDKSLIEVDTETIREIEVSSGEVSRTFVPHQEGAKRTWVLKGEGGEAGGDVDTKPLDDLAFDLVDLVADHWVADAASPEHGLDAPRVVLDVTWRKEAAKKPDAAAASQPAPEAAAGASGESEPRPAAGEASSGETAQAGAGEEQYFRLMIGARGGGGGGAAWYFARVEGDPIVCAVRKAIVDTLLRAVGLEPDALEPAATTPASAGSAPAEEAPAADASPSGGDPAATEEGTNP